MGSGGDSIGLFLLVIVVIAIVGLVAILVLRRRKAPAQAGGSVPDESSGGHRPLYKDPDPEGMAGGRTISEPPER